MAKKAQAASTRASETMPRKPLFRISYSGEMSDRRRDALNQRAEPADSSEPMPIASGIEFHILPGGDVLVEFYGDDGHTFNRQVVERNTIHSLPITTTLVKIALECGEKVLLQQTHGLDQKGLYKLVIATLYAEAMSDSTGQDAKPSNDTSKT